MHLAEQKDGWECSVHTHKNHEIGYIIKGEGSYDVGGVGYWAKAGDIFIIPPNVPHFEVKSQRQPFEIMFIMVKHYGKGSKRLIDIIKRLQGRIHLAQETKIKDIFKDIYNEIIIKNPGYLSIIDAKLKILYLLLYREIHMSSLSDKKKNLKMITSERNRYVIGEVKQLIMKNIEKNLTINFIAQNFYYHPNYLSQLIKNDTGKSLNEYIIGLRMERAMEMLSSTDSSIEQIAASLGFSSTEYFYKRFKKEVGMTPNQYRSKFLNLPKNSF